jgi:hypothetical protein
MELNWSKEQSPETQKNNSLKTNQQHNEEDIKPEKKNNTSPDQDYDDDLLIKEGYLPEIYFSLRSDNPADW